MAASLAYQDASLSHTKNGIYGEIFVASVISAALVSDNLNEVLKAGLSQIPANSRINKLVKEVMSWSEESSSLVREVWEMVENHYGEYHGVYFTPIWLMF